jgi:hypothetical protein
MSQIQSHQIFYINSTDRLDGTDESFSFELLIDLSANYDHVCLLQCSIPKSYYLIQSGFNTFTLREGGDQATVTIAPGNYSYLSFMAVIPPLLNAASPNGWTYGITYPNRLVSPDTGLFTYSVTGNGGIQPAIVTTTNVYEQLGFLENSTNNFVGNTLISTSVINFSQEETLFIHSDCADNKTDDILQEIYDNNSPPMSFIVWQNQGTFEAYSKKLKLNSSRTFYFHLTDENGRLMILNGRNVLYTLCVYKKDNINEVIRQVVRMSVH